MGSGTNFPGKIALSISPDIFSHLVRQNKKEIITITGTNGKTTTAGLIASIFEKYGRKTVHNRKGANMLTGLIVAAVEKSSINGKLDSDNCIFEIDEAYMNLVFDEFNPDIVIVTNLFRDQLDRYGELNTTAQKIESAIKKRIGGRDCRTSKACSECRLMPPTKSPLKLILNADDPLVSRIMEDFDERIFYGFEEIKYLDQEEKSSTFNAPSSQTPLETVNCKCGKPFIYSKTFYGHLGCYECSCGAKRPELTVSASALIGVDHSVINIKSADYVDFEIKVNLPGLYNCYNALAAVTAAIEAGIPAENIKKGIENYSTTFGRAERLELKGKKVLIQLIKNPIGATEVIRTIKNDKKGKLFILINDNYADGRDVSWLWDANFELLADYDKTAVISGTRATDMAIRLKYAGISSQNLIIKDNIKKALLYALDNVQKDEQLYILPTYTALLELDKIKKNLI